VEISVEYEYRILKESSVRYQYRPIENYESLEDWNIDSNDKNWPWDNKQIVTYVNTGIKIPEVENRGKVILLVDSSFVNSLKYELKRFETDLIGDGWTVLRRDVSRDASVKYVKSIIRDLYLSDTSNVSTVILFGHMPIPYSGCAAYDCHPEEVGAWQADLYYGSMNEKIWTDTIVGRTGTLRMENINLHGDGKFDLTVLPPDEMIKLQIGRIDLSRMPAFPESESELLKRYLDKNHAFRHKVISPDRKALIDDKIGWFGGDAFSLVGWRNFIPLLNSSNVKTGAYFGDMEQESYIWSLACAPGYPGYVGDSLRHIGSTYDFLTRNIKNVFTALFGSYCGNWDYPNSLLRAVLASDGWGLASCWIGRPYYTFHQMGTGNTIGYCVRVTQNNINTYDYNMFSRCIHIGMQGDPTLRMHIVCPVNSLQSDSTNDSTIVLTWNPADDNIIGYYVYKLDTVINEYEKITPTPVTETRFEDTEPVDGQNYYMVRTLKLTQSESGSYYNLSQGIFDTIEFSVQTDIDMTDNIKQTTIYPNPSTGVFVISFSKVLSQQATIKVYNIQGMEILSRIVQNTSTVNIDLSDHTEGIYILRIITDGENYFGKICID
jgi:hypothetical protein